MIAPLAAMALAHNPVLLVHGIDDTGAVFRAMQPRLQAQGFVTETLDMVPNNGDASLKVLAAQIKDRVEALCARTSSAHVDVVAFSLGGIASRYYLQRLGGAERVQRFVVISSPHHGTWTGYLRWNVGGSELRPNSPFLNDLNRDWTETAGRVQVTSIWTPFDLMIVPSNSSHLPLAHEVQVPVVLHPWMLVDPRCSAAVARELSRPLDHSSSESSSSSR